MALNDFKTLFKLYCAIFFTHINTEFIEITWCYIYHFFLWNCSTSILIAISWISKAILLTYDWFLNLFTNISLISIFLYLSTHLRSAWSNFLILIFIFTVLYMLVILLVLVIEKWRVFIVLLKIFLRWFISLVDFKLLHLFLCF